MLIELALISVNDYFLQLGIKNSQPLAFGLVEYITPEDAALAQEYINGHNLVGHCIRASFCTPGISTQQTYNEIAQIRVSLLLSELFYWLCSIFWITFKFLFKDYV